MTFSPTLIWTVIVLLAVGTFALRFSFLGLIGKRQLPDWALRLLRYTPVAVIPGLMAPQIFLPPAGETTADPVRLLAAAVTVVAGLWTRNVIWAMIAGATTMIALTLLT